ncbi:HET-domain-containing protein [Ophiobolus disseminans]|uniref:HET-domain-containing protein n=1 Tax=Ophiobolus disseminans TaxID=1469910 RepID=A0A6A6ZY52_9PLEO|nr:HET-domain-containing protein [Ophiobolus disseminans]
MFCDRCQHFWKEAIKKAQIADVIKNSEDVHWATHETILHRTIGDLKRASGHRCRLCRVIYSTPTQYEHETLLKDHDEAIDVILDINPNNGPHPVLSVQFRAANGGNVKISKRMVASCELETALDRSGDLINDNTGSDGALELAAYWTKRCIATHEKCRPATLASVDTPFVPTRLIDVSNGSIRLIESAQELDKTADRRFVALSHCWGLVPIIRTLKNNLPEHLKNIEPSQLSKTFRDAIHVTRKLGYRYVWMDSLCIVQDDGEDWAREAETMCDVYQCAILTIAAAHASGGDIGCFTERDGLLNLPFYIELPSFDITKRASKIQFTSYGRVGALAGGDPVLFGRAWLSWECLSAYGSEKTPTSGTMRHSAYHRTIRTGIMDNTEYFRWPNRSNESNQSDAYWDQLKHQHWCNLIMDYTHRGMTQSKDRLVALAGVAKALSQHTESKYWAGLWSKYFTAGLLWSLAHSDIFQIASATGFDFERNKKVRHEQPIAPSWSWASVTTPVIYEQSELLSYDRMHELIKVDVSGTIDQQFGRMKIRGHVRRGYVNVAYPHSICEAAAWLPHMMTPRPTGRRGLEYINFKDRVFHANDYFLFSEMHPAPTLKNVSPHHVSKKGNYRFVRGYFRPDELIDPCTEITFIAIAQQHFGASLKTRLPTHDDASALKVHTLALVPSRRKPGEYRRVGLAAWDECAWYGYLCGFKDEMDRKVYRPGNYFNGFLQDDGFRDKLARSLGWDDLEMLDECETGAHDHGYEKDALPEIGNYHQDVDVMERTIEIA